VQDSTCEECRIEAETTGHLFWYCPRAREVWERVFKAGRSCWTESLSGLI